MSRKIRLVLPALLLVALASTASAEIDLADLSLDPAGEDPSAAGFVPTAQYAQTSPVPLHPSTVSGKISLHLSPVEMLVFTGGKAADLGSVDTDYSEILSPGWGMELEFGWQIIPLVNLHADMGFFLFATKGEFATGLEPDSPLWTFLDFLAGLRLQFPVNVPPRLWTAFGAGSRGLIPYLELDVGIAGHSGLDARDTFTDTSHDYFSSKNLTVVRLNLGLEYRSRTVGFSFQFQFWNLSEPDSVSGSALETLADSASSATLFGFQTSITFNFA